LDGPDSEVVYYESIKRDLKTRLTYSGFLGELEHLKIKTRLIDERFLSVMGEYVFLKR
jgi:hypothetical protein